RFWLTGLVRPVSKQPDVRSTTAEEFRTEAGSSVSTNIPVVKAALVHLADIWPRASCFEDLWNAVQTRLTGAPVADASGVPWDDASVRRLAEAMLQFYLTHMVMLHVHAPKLVTEVSERPVASAVARWQAANGARVASLRHCIVPVNEIDRQVLPLLDGTRDR